MSDRDWLAAQFEEQRPHLRRVAYRMLGSLDESEDAIQEAWLRLSRSDESAIENLGGWLTTVVGRVCLDMLRARRTRREDSADGWLPEPIVSLDDQTDSEQEALLADSVGLALLVASRHSALPSASPSSFTTCLPSRSTRSPRSSIAALMRFANSPAGAAAASAGPGLSRTPTSPNSGRWPRRS